MPTPASGSSRPGRRSSPSTGRGGRSPYPLCSVMPSAAPHPEGSARASSRVCRSGVGPVAFACALAATLACAGSAPAPRAPRPLADEEVALLARTLQATDARRADTSVFDAALGARSSPVRVAATLAIGQVHALARAGRLRQLLTDGDTAVAASAAFALGLARDSSSATLEALVSALKLSPTVAREAAWALGEVG